MKVSAESIGAPPDYLGVRYSARTRPLTDYPDRLAHYLTTHHLGSYQGGSLLDLGCGRGEFLRAFSRVGFRAQGIDRQHSAHVNELPFERVDFEKEALPFGDDSFDIVFNKSVLEHIRDVSPLLGECRRVLKPGGSFLCMVPDFVAQWSHFYDDWTHVRPFTLTGLKECLLSHGFTIRSAERFRQLPLLWERPYLKPLADVSALLPRQFKRHKWVRFSKEWMLLVDATKSPQG